MPLNVFGQRLRRYEPLKPLSPRKAGRRYAAVGLVCVYFACGATLSGSCVFISDLEDRFSALPEAKRRNVLVTAAHVLKPPEQTLRNAIRLRPTAEFDYSRAVSIVDLHVHMFDGTHFSVDPQERVGWVANAAYSTTERNVLLGSDIALMRCQLYQL